MANCDRCRIRKRARVLLVFGVLSLVPPVIKAQPKRTFTLDRDVQTSSVWTDFPKWNARRLVGWEGDYTDAPVLYTIDRDGRREEFLFTISDAGGISISDVAIAPDGQIAVVGGAYTTDGRSAAFVVRISPDRKSQTITRTLPYWPIKATFSADGCVWTIGRLNDKENTRVIAEQVIRRYDASGTPLGSRNVNLLRPLRRTIEVSFLFSSRDRVGWFTTGGEYIEFSLDGQEIGRYEGPGGSERAEMSGVAMSEENDVVAGNFGGGTAEFVALDRSSRTWAPVSLQKEHAPSWGWVLGFDGPTLVTTTKNGTLRRFRTK